MANVNHQFLLSMAIIFLGYICKRSGVIKEKDGEGISRIIFNLTLPSLVINTFSTLKIDFSLMLLPVLNVAFGCIMAAFAIFLFRKESREQRGMLSMVLPGLNVGLFAYPLVEALWGDRGLKYFAMFDIGSAIIVFGVCYLMAGYFASEAGEMNFKGVLRALGRSIPLMVYMITLGVKLAGFQFPGFIVSMAGILGRANMPLSLLLLGIYLSFNFERKFLSKMAKVLAARYLIGLTLGTVLYWLLPFDPLFRKTILIGFILPIGGSVIPFSVEFGYDRKFVGTLANITIAFSFVLMWAIIAVVGGM